MRYQVFIGCRVGRSHIETTELQVNEIFLGNVLVSICPAKIMRDYSTNGLLHETH